MHGYGAGSYGDGLADVYDDWYADVSPIEDTVTFLARRSDGLVLELGSGTGRLAGPLSDAGVPVVGLDASLSMLRRARVHDASAVVLAADMTCPPIAAGSVSGAFVAFNTLFNVPTAEGQQQVFDAVARLLRPGGWFVVEAFVPAERPDPTDPTDPTDTPDTAGTTDTPDTTDTTDPTDTTGATDGRAASSTDDRVELGRMDATSVTLRLSRTDHDAQTVIGHFVELRDGQPVRLRPWSLRYAGPTELDTMARTAGFTLGERHADWSGAPFDDDASAHVSVYRKSPSAPPDRQ